MKYEIKKEDNGWLIIYPENVEDVFKLGVIVGSGFDAKQTFTRTTDSPSELTKVEVSIDNIIRFLIQ